MKFLLPLFLLFFLACSAQNELERLSTNEGLAYMLEDSAQNHHAYVQILKRDEGNFSLQMRFGEMDSVFIGEFEDLEDEIVLSDFIAARKMRAKLEFKESAPVMKVFLDTSADTNADINSTPLELKLANKKLNTLNLVHAELVKKKTLQYEGEERDINFVIKNEALLIPQSAKLDQSVIEAINLKLASGAKDVKELQAKLGASQKQKMGGEEFNYNTELSNSYELFYSDDKTALFFVYDYEYFGGAHGLWLWGTRIFSLEDGQEISNKSSHLFDVHDEKLINLLNEALSAKYKEATKDFSSFVTLFDNENVQNLIYVPESFFIRENGVEFFWQPYEIAPYAMGFIRVNLSFSELAPFVKKESKLAYLFEK